MIRIHFTDGSSLETYLSKDIVETEIDSGSAWIGISDKNKTVYVQKTNITMFEVIKEVEQ